MEVARRMSIEFDVSCGAARREPRPTKLALGVARREPCTPRSGLGAARREPCLALPQVSWPLQVGLEAALLFESRLNEESVVGDGAKRRGICFLTRVALNTDWLNEEKIGLLTRAALNSDRWPG
jgi:hypothetical protein